MSQYQFEVGQVYTISFFGNNLEFKITKINSKGISLKNEATRVELKDYQVEDLSKIIVKQ
jgi:hypothetical protein